MEETLSIQSSDVERPDLDIYGIPQIDRGICLDTYEHRAILRSLKFSWIAVFTDDGKPTDLIEVRTPEMITAHNEETLEKREAILENPLKKNSDYLTGIELLLVDNLSEMVPPWVIHATRTWNQLQRKMEANPDKKYKTAFKNPPGRCKFVKSDGGRCILWHAGRENEAGLCRTHLLSKLNPELVSHSLETARRRVKQSAPSAADTLGDLLENATSEPVRLKAATEILDRAGIRGGVEVDTNINLEVKPARDMIENRLERLVVQRMAEQQELPMLEATVVEDGDEDDRTRDNGSSGA